MIYMVDTREIPDHPFGMYFVIVNVLVFPM